MPEYSKAIKIVAEEIMKDQSPQKLKNLRDPMLKLLINGVPCDIIIVSLVKEMCSIVKKEEVKRLIIHWASFYDSRAQNGTKALFHLEALIARMMLVISENK